MFVIVAYDITDDARRRMVQQALEGAGTRVQCSVFECELTEAQVESLKNRIAPLIEPAEDEVRWYRPCAVCGVLIERDGSGPVAEDPPFLVV